MSVSVCYSNIEENVLRDVMALGSGAMKLFVRLLDDADYSTGLLYLTRDSERMMLKDIGMSLKSYASAKKALEDKEILLPLGSAVDSFGVTVSAPGLYALNPMKVWKGEDYDLQSVTVWRKAKFDNDGAETGVEYMIEYKGVDTFIPENIRSVCVSK